MLIRKNLRRQLAHWLVLVILFMQMVTAAYACPLYGAGSNDGSTPATSTMPCAGMMAADTAPMLDSDQPALCMHHCRGAIPALEHGDVVPHFAAAPTAVLTIRLPEALEPEGLGRAFIRRTQEHPPAPFHRIVHCCLRT